MTNNVSQVTQSEQDKKLEALKAASPMAPLSQAVVEHNVAPEDAVLTTPWTS